MGLVVAAFGCGNHGSYVCASSTQCVQNGVHGTCETQGFCSFPDTGCPSGSRFESGAGDDLGGECVPEGNPADASTTCGAVGQACCVDGEVGSPPCLDNGFCSNGTCAQCVTDVGTGLRHNCYLKQDHTVWCSGENRSGQLGNGGTSTVAIATPVQVRDMANTVVADATGLALGGVHSCAIRAGGEVWCWGENNTCTDGGQLGDGTTTNRDRAVPVIRTNNMRLTDIVELGASYCNTCARDSTGGVWCWGDNENNRLGDGTIVSRTKAAPVLVAAGGAAFTGAAELSVGDQHACVRKTNGETWCWGSNYAGQVGNTTKVNAPVPVKVMDTTISISAGRYHTCAVKTDNSVWCWGQGWQGRLGNGKGDRDSGSTLDEPTPKPALTALGGTPFGGAKSVAAGAVSCSLSTTNAASCWGAAQYGQTGTGGGTYVPAPVLDVDGKPLTSVERLVTKFTRVCAFLTSGRLVCWGRNSEGEMGDGTFVNHGLATPIRLSCP